MISLWHQVKILLAKDFTMEWRNRHTLNGLLLYIAGAVYVAYLSLNVRKSVVLPPTWNAVFWIILLFCSIHATAKTFTAERSERYFFYYTLVSAEALMISKLIYNGVFLSLINVLAMVLYMWVMGNPVQDTLIYTLLVVLGSVSLSGALTFVSALAAKTTDKGALMAVLSFPLVLPIVLFCIKISIYALDGLELSAMYKDMGLLMAIATINYTLAILLYPFIHRG